SEFRSQSGPPVLVDNDFKVCRTEGHLVMIFNKPASRILGSQAAEQPLFTLCLRLVETGPLLTFPMTQDRQCRDTRPDTARAVSHRIALQRHGSGQVSQGLKPL